MHRIEQLKQFAKLNPADSFVQHALALEFIKRGDDNQARTLFEELLQRDPQYVGSYYHVGKLMERAGDNEAAMNWYEKGMAAAKQAGDQHSYNELQAAYENLMD